MCSCMTDVIEVSTQCKVFFVSLLAHIVSHLVNHRNEVNFLAQVVCVICLLNIDCV